MIPTTITNPTRVYVAGSAASDETIKLANDVADELLRRGFEVPFRWTASGVRDLYRRGRLDVVGRMEHRAILQADLVVALPGRLGTAMEIGIAVGLGTPVHLFVVDDLSPASSAWLGVPFIHAGTPVRNGDRDAMWCCDPTSGWARVFVHKVSAIDPAAVVDAVQRRMAEPESYYEVSDG